MINYSDVSYVMIQSCTNVEITKNMFLQRATLKHHLNNPWLGQMTVVRVTLL